MLLLKSDETFHELYVLHSGGVKRFLSGMVGRNNAIAEELAQDTFIKAWKSLPTFSGKSTFKTWVYKIAINTARDWLRTHSGRISHELGGEESSQAETQESLAVKEILFELDEDTRALLVLYYYEELNHKELAKVFQIPEGTVKSRLYSGKKKLRTLLLEKGFDV